jgi:TRAP-type C4-dicarboxylate transport system substrate-binding protein
MIAELIADADTFEKLAADIQKVMKPVREKLGIRDEELDAAVEKQLAQQREGQGLPLK